MKYKNFPKPLTVSLTEEMYEYIQEYATNRKTSMGMIVRSMLNYVREEEMKIGGTENVTETKKSASKPRRTRTKNTRAKSNMTLKEKNHEQSKESV